MLLQCKENRIELFPGVPAEWKNISFDLLAAGNVRVKAVMKNGELQAAELLCKSDRHTKVIFKNKEINIDLKKVKQKQ